MNENLNKANAGPMPDESLHNIFETVMAEMRALQQQLIGK